MRDPSRDYCLMLQARLMHALSTYGIYAQPGMIERHPKMARLFIRPTAGTRHRTVLALHREIQAALGVKCRVMSDERGLYVDATLPAEYWRVLSFAGMLRKAIRIADVRQSLGVPALLGLDEEGRIVLVDLAGAVTPHILLAGTTGSGKTNLLLSIILSLAAMNRPSRVQLFILDAKGHSFPATRTLPHVRAVAVTPEDWLTHAAYVVMQMEERQAGRAGAAWSAQSGTHLILIIDELADVLMTDERETGGALGESLVRLTQKGRDVGVHLIAATQKPSARVVNSLVTSNLPCRLVGQVVSGLDAALATGQKGSGANLLPGRGSFVVVAGGRMDRLTAPLVRDGDVEMVGRMTRHGPPTGSEAAGDRAGTQDRIAAAQDFLTRLKERRGRKGPGRPVEPPRAQEVQALVDYYARERHWPASRRAAQRIVGQASGKKIAGVERTEAALAEAKRRVAARPDGATGQ